MFKKLTVFLLLLNFAAVLFVGYKINKTLSREVSTIKTVLTMEPDVVDGDQAFRKNVYNGLSILMSGQSQLAVNQDRLNVDILRIHHFVEPHVNSFYKNCPECQKDKEAIIREEEAENQDG